MKVVCKGTQSVVEFKDNTITIDIDTDRVTEKDGWKLHPLNPPLVCSNSSRIVIMLHTYIHCFLYMQTDTSEFC